MLIFFRALCTTAMIGSLWLGQALAGTVTVPLNSTTKRPASDLVASGRRIDEAEAGDLVQKGIELWRYDPEESLLWKDARFDAASAAEDSRLGFPREGAVVRFDSYLASTRGIFRSSVDVAQPAGAAIPVRPFTLSVSLNNPAALMRAALLRKIGYQVSSPRLFRTLTVRFDDLAARDQFLDNLADRSLTSRKRWIRDLPEGKPEVTLQGVVLEAGRIQVQTVHWGMMSAALQRDRRVFRALLVPDVLVDFQEKVNALAWEPGRVFNGAALFDYLYSDGFADVAYDDIKWITARLARLAREDFREAVRLAGLPADISALLTEKLVSRRNALVRMLGLGAEAGLLPVDTGITVGNVVQGQLTRDDYEGYPLEFFGQASLPPLRFSQLWRFAAIEGISAGLGQLLNQVNKNLLTLETSSSATSRHQEEVSQGIAKYLFRTGNLTGYEQTTGVWAKPIAGAHINASRSVVAGTYLGSDSQVQLVDSLSVDVGGGFYVGWDGAAPLAPGVSNTVTLMRTYSHIKPVQDMKAALKANWGRIVVAGFMRHLSGALDPDIQCAIPEGPWTSEFELDGVKYTKINYDQKRPQGREEALALRAKLIAGGASPDRILLQANDREQDCKSEVEKAVNKNLESFMDGLAVGDTFMVTDSVKLAAAASVNISVAELLGAGFSITPGVTHGYEIARQTMLKRTSNGFQVYLQDRKLDTKIGAIDFNFFVSFMNLSGGGRHGQASTDYYNIVTEGADTDTKRKLIRSVKALLRSNSAEVLTDSFEPYTLKHDLFARLLKFKFLLWSLNREKQRHEVDVYPPLDPKGGRNRGDYKRTLAMRRDVTRTGQDWFGFLMQAVGRLTGGIVNLPGLAGGSGDPGNSPLGKSLTQSVSTQAEVTEKAAFKPVTVVEQTYRGWVITRKDLFKIFDRIEGTYGEVTGPRSSASRALFNRSLFNNASSVQLYQLDTTLLFYPEALEEIRNWLFGGLGERALFQHLIGINGVAKTRIYCDIAESQFGRNGPQVYRGAQARGCAPDWVHAIMKLRAQGLPEARRDQLGWYNSLLTHVLDGGSVGNFLKRLDSRHFFFVTRVNGFRKGDNNGSVEYLSDTVGRYDNERGLGMYRDFSSAYGISLFEVYGRFFTEGL